MQSRAWCVRMYSCKRGATRTHSERTWSHVQHKYTSACMPAHVAHMYAGVHARPGVLALVRACLHASLCKHACAKVYANVYNKSIHEPGHKPLKSLGPKSVHKSMHKSMQSSCANMYTMYPSTGAYAMESLGICLHACLCTGAHAIESPATRIVTHAWHPSSAHLLISMGTDASMHVWSPRVLGTLDSAGFASPGNRQRGACGC